MKSTGGRVGNFLWLGVKGGVWKKTRFGTAMVVEKYCHPPLLRVCWVLASEWKCVWDVKVYGYKLGLTSNIFSNYDPKYPGKWFFSNQPRCDWLQSVLSGLTFRMTI